MTTAPVAGSDRWLVETGTGSPQTWARIAGVLFLISYLAGGFGEWYVPSRIIVSGDAVATARHILASESLVRLGFAGYLIEALCDVSLTWALYVLLRPAGRELALLAVFLRLISTAVFAMAEVFSVGPLLILKGAGLQAFGPPQLEALGTLSLKFYAYGGVIPMVFYGAAWCVLGLLVVRSGYLPKFLGVLLALGGISAVVRYFAYVVAPGTTSSAFLLPLVTSGLVLMLWLLIRGVDVPRWHERAAALGGRP